MKISLSARSAIYWFWSIESLQKVLFAVIEKGMNMKNYIFDLYGTLVDIHTNEAKTSLWKNMAFIFSMMGAEYAPVELRKRYKELTASESLQQLSFIQDKFHDKRIAEDEIEIQLEKVFYRMFSDRGIAPEVKQMAQLGITFRSLSLSYIRLYDDVPELLQRLREAGKKIYLLSNAQRMFTEPEMRMLGIYDMFDGILYSSDAGVKKPSFYFYDTLFQRYGLKKEESVMIGNEYRADVLGAAKYGIKSMYVYTAQSGEKPEFLPEGCKETGKISEVFKEA